jgi:hypothetical protein
LWSFSNVQSPEEDVNYALILLERNGKWFREGTHFDVNVYYKRFIISILVVLRITLFSF